MNELLEHTLPTVEELYKELLKQEPKLVSNTVPDDAAEVKRAFLQGEREQPGHVYSKMEKYPRDAPERIRELSKQFDYATDVDPSTRSSYDMFCKNYVDKAEMLLMMNDYRSSEGAIKEQCAAEYMKRNIELFGEPEEETYLSFVHEVLAKTEQFSADSDASKLASEVVSTLGLDTSRDLAPERFKPSNETMEWMNLVVNELYSGILSHIPDKSSLTVIELQAAWNSILTEEFGGAAEGWEVVLEPAKSINVRASEKKVVIPEDRADVSQETARGLTVHEIGVHVYRSITGESTNVGPLANGMVDYYDAEEGLGAVVEQALTGKYREAGVGHYITAGLAYFNNFDFRQTFEMRWRLNAISAADDQGEISQATREKARSSAYGQTMRIMRGTDDLPWFKDLAYYNGGREVWQYLEKHRGDEFMLSLLLQGKRNTSQEHQRVVLESRTVR